MHLHRLWILERKVIVLNTPPTEKVNLSTDLEILVFVSEFIYITINSYSDLDHWFLSADDDNRIVLKPLSDISDCQRDYINACYVDVRELIY